jgi:hypothetical protein
MFNPKIENCLLSKRLLDSSANEEIVVNEPQKPIATSREYFGSRFQLRVTILKEIIENSSNLDFKCLT